MVLCLSGCVHILHWCYVIRIQDDGVGGVGALTAPWGSPSLSSFHPLRLLVRFTCTFLSSRDDLVHPISLNGLFITIILLMGFSFQARSYEYAITWSLAVVKQSAHKYQGYSGSLVSVDILQSLISTEYLSSVWSKRYVLIEHCYFPVSCLKFQNQVAVSRILSHRRNESRRMDYFVLYLYQYLTFWFSTSHH